VINHYFQFWARIAIKEQYQKQYFALFDTYYHQEKVQYLWGYSRILLWYYNFNNPNILLDYRDHFCKILNHLLSKNALEFSLQYKQNAFISLMYLLTFRAFDPSFCQKESTEIKLAYQVIEHFRSDKINFNKIDKKRSLPELFEEMIEGTASESNIKNMIKIN
jgi:hypothetical protein